MAPPKRNRKCSIEGCEKPHVSHDFCATHRKRFKLYGDPLFTKQKQIHGATVAERWNAYVGERGAGCWEWAGHRDPNGYGRLNISGKPVLAHRISWELHRRPITPAEHILHRCDNPPCVRPEHLFKGDQALNMADKMAKKRHRYGTTQGEKNPISKVNEGQVREIRASSEKPGGLAIRFGLSRRTIRDIQTRKSWKHIP